MIARDVAVIGGGRMGSGIAHAFLRAGSRVQLRDVDETTVEHGLQNIRASIHKAYERGTLHGTPDATLHRLVGRVGLGHFGELDLAVEAVPEVAELKRSVLTSISIAVGASTVIATNTSSLSVTDLATAVSRPQRFVGMHFFNPVPVSALVEIVRGAQTSEETIGLATGWTAALGKEAIVAADAPGFATSRLGLVIGLEAIRMLEEGVAAAEDIDRGMVLGYGFPIGPLRLTDIVGLDVRLEIATHLESVLGERFRAPALLRDKVRSGDLGRKSGRGFYRWEASHQ